MAGSHAGGLAFLDSTLATPATPPIGGRRVRLDLRRCFSHCAVLDCHYLVVDNVPPAARLSAGRYNGDGSWSLAPGEIDGLVVLVPSEREAPFTLTVSLLVPDACGYDFASTAAQADIEVTPGLASASPELEESG